MINEIIMSGLMKFGFTRKKRSEDGEEVEDVEDTRANAKRLRRSSAEATATGRPRVFSGQIYRLCRKNTLLGLSLDHFIFSNRDLTHVEHLLPKILISRLHPADDLIIRTFDRNTTMAGPLNTRLVST